MDKTCPCSQENPLPNESTAGGKSGKSKSKDKNTFVKSRGIRSRKANKLPMVGLEAIGTSTDVSDCIDANGGHCVSETMIVAIAEFIKTVPISSSGGQSAQEEQSALSISDLIVSKAAGALSCDSESCVITHPSFRKFGNSSGLATTNQINGELETRFKAVGPREGNSLLSNVHIDETLQRWARVFTKFYCCPFAMMDFELNDDKLGKINISEVFEGKVPLEIGRKEVVLRPANTFACVLNTDTSSGPGKHWVALFVDNRDPVCTIEYFNSAGNPPTKPVVRWMAKAKKRLAHKGVAAEIVAVTDVDHQESQTECGVYTLYYVRRRLEGTPYTFFFERLVPDDLMTEFRKHCFR